MHIISIAVVFSLSAAYRLTGSRGLFAGQGQLLALFSGKIGSYLRVAYYSMTLEECSSQAYVGFGSFFLIRKQEWKKRSISVLTA